MFANEHESIIANKQPIAFEVLMFFAVSQIGVSKRFSVADDLRLALTAALSKPERKTFKA